MRTPQNPILIINALTLQPYSTLIVSLKGTLIDPFKGTLF